MVFSKSFPRPVERPVFSEWQEIELSPEEEVAAEQMAKETHSRLMQECVNESAALLRRCKLKNYQSDVISIALALFHKRSSHVSYYKALMCKEEFYNMRNLKRSGKQ